MPSIGPGPADPGSGGSPELAAGADPIGGIGGAPLPVGGVMPVVGEPPAAAKFVLLGGCGTSKGGRLPIVFWLRSGSDEVEPMLRSSGFPNAVMPLPGCAGGVMPAAIGPPIALVCFSPPSAAGALVRVSQPAVFASADGAVPIAVGPAGVVAGVVVEAAVAGAAAGPGPAATPVPGAGVVGFDPNVELGLNRALPPLSEAVFVRQHCPQPVRTVVAQTRPNRPRTGFLPIAFPFPR